MLYTRQIMTLQKFSAPKWCRKYLSDISSHNENRILKETVNTKILILSYSSLKFSQKNIWKYVFDVKFSAQYDPGVRKNKKNVESLRVEKTWKIVKSL